MISSTIFPYLENLFGNAFLMGKHQNCSELLLKRKIILNFYLNLLYFAKKAINANIILQLKQNILFCLSDKVYLYIDARIEGNKR